MTRFEKVDERARRIVRGTQEPLSGETLRDAIAPFAMVRTAKETIAKGTQMTEDVDKLLEVCDRASPQAGRRW
jgi:hypothetical protein